MKREDFIFTIGYQGDTAIVDGKAKKKYEKLSLRELAEKGLFKEAFCAALHSGEEADLREFLSLYRRLVPGINYEKEDLARLFGVFGVPQGITRTKIID